MHQQGPEFNGYLVGRGNAREIDLNRDFPDLNALMYYYEKTKGRNHHLPLPDNWEHQVSSAEYNWNRLRVYVCVKVSMCVRKYVWLGAYVGEREGRSEEEDGWGHLSCSCERVSEAE